MTNNILKEIAKSIIDAFNASAYYEDYNIYNTYAPTNSDKSYFVFKITNVKEMQMFEKTNYDLKLTFAYVSSKESVEDSYDVYKAFMTGVIDQIAPTNTTIAFKDLLSIKTVKSKKMDKWMTALEYRIILEDE